MAAAPRWKIFDAHHKYQASTHDLAAAAALMAFYGDGATIRDGHRLADVVWAEGAEDRQAAESYDFVTNTVLERVASGPRSRWTADQLAAGAAS